MQLLDLLKILSFFSSRELIVITETEIMADLNIIAQDLSRLEGKVALITGVSNAVQSIGIMIADNRRGLFRYWPCSCKSFPSKRV
jgi:hypothetical protein